MKNTMEKFPLTLDFVIYILDLCSFNLIFEMYGQMYSDAA